MSFDDDSAPIVRLGWERHLGLPADSLVLGDTQRLTFVDPTTVTFVRLWGQTVLCGPESILSAAASLTDDQLSDHALMLALTRDIGGRGLGTKTLYFADDLPVRQPPESLLVSHGNPEAVALESLCPPDDVNDVALATMSHKFTLMAQDEEGHDAGPVATGAYADFGGTLANLGTLVAPEYRHRGLGSLATSIATHDALASGYIVQARIDVNNKAAHSLALSLGLNVCGLQTSVSL